MGERRTVTSGINESWERKGPTQHIQPSFNNLQPAQETWSLKPASEAEIVNAIYSHKNHRPLWARRHNAAEAKRRVVTNTALPPAAHQ